MECLHDPILLLWLFFASLSFVILQTRRLGRAPFPPGPKPLPIIGNMALVDQLTHRGLGALAKQYGGLLHLRFGWLHVFAVSTPEYAREVLQAQDGAFSNRPATMAVDYLTYGRSDMALAHNGAYWRQMRKLCVTKMFSRRRAETWLAVRDGSSRGSWGCSTSATSSRGSAGSAGGASTAASARARGALDRFIDKIVDEHMRRGKDSADPDADLVDGLLAFLAEADAASGKHRKDAIRFTHHNVKAMIMDMLFGGPETVGSTTEWAMAEMMRSPSELRRLQRELADVVGLDRTVDESDLDKLPFLKCVVKEALRMHPPIPVLLHEAAKDCIVGGYLVPRSSRVLVNTWAINRDRNAWKDADTFRPSRFIPGEGEAAGLDLKGGCYEFGPFGSARRRGSASTPWN
ncbi:hypothetical protein ACQ4PT_009577 [Festuca glaucescens]